MSRRWQVAILLAFAVVFVPVFTLVMGVIGLFLGLEESTAEVGRQWKAIREGKA